MSDWDDVLGYAATQLEELGRMYEESLREKQTSPQLAITIKNIVENQRSALDYVAHAIVERYGRPGLCYFPITDSTQDFEARLKRNLPGVDASRPDLVALIKGRQPYVPGYEWMADLRHLSNGNKHRHLSPQTRREEHRRQAANGSVSWDPGSVRFGSGVFIGGRPVDPGNQRTSDTVDIIFVDWWFSDLGKSVRTTLAAVQVGATALVGEVTTAAGLA